MTEGRQDLAAVIAELRAEASVFSTPRVGETPRHWPLGEKLNTWADRLALLLAEAPRLNDRLEIGQWHMDTSNHHNALACPYCNPKGLKFEEQKEDTDTREDRPSTSSVASRTAATDVAEGARLMTPDQVSNVLRERYRRWLALSAEKQYRGDKLYDTKDLIEAQERAVRQLGEYLDGDEYLTAMIDFALAAPSPAPAPVTPTEDKT